MSEGVSIYRLFGSLKVKLTESFEIQLKDFVQMNESVLLVVSKEYIFSEQEKQLSFINFCLVHKKMIYKER